MLAQNNGNWHRADVIAEVRKRGATLAALARGCGLSRQSFSWALIKPHQRANEAIANFLGQHISSLWPEWFDQEGNPRARTASARPTNITRRYPEGQ